LAAFGLASFAKKSAHLIFSHRIGKTINPSLKSLTCAGVAVLRLSILERFRRDELTIAVKSQSSNIILAP